MPDHPLAPPEDPGAALLLGSQPLPGRRSVMVTLPPAYAAAAVHRLFTEYLRCSVGAIEPPNILPDGRPLPPDHWIIVSQAKDYRVLAKLFRGRDGQPAIPRLTDDLCWLAFPLHTLYIDASWEFTLRGVLEQLKPEPLGTDGLPLPWSPARPPTEALDDARPRREDDVETVPDGPPLPASTTPPASAQTPLDPASDAQIQQALWALCARVGLGQVPLTLRRPAHPRDGFVAGRIQIAPTGPRAIHLEIDANADAAEVWATLLHEVAHALAPRDGHSAAFQRRLVALAGEVFGSRHLAAAAEAVGTTFATVDAWVAVCVRAALRGVEPPLPEAGDEGSLARVVARIQKLRRLARRHPGTPESIAACAKANDLLVRWGLGSYRVRLEAGIDEQMCDRWVDVGHGVVWKRQLCFVVARYCGVFSLARAQKGWMHFFGRHEDVVTAEWFFEIWRDHIERTCAAHLQAFRAQGTGRSTRSERTNFCDSAVVGIRRKLQQIPDEGGEAVPAAVRLAAAERFAGEAFARRGLRWGGGSGKSITLNADGLAAGAAAPMGRGVGGPGGPRGLLGD